MLRFVGFAGIITNIFFTDKADFGLDSDIRAEIYNHVYANDKG